MLELSQWCIEWGIDGLCENWYWLNACRLALEVAQEALEMLYPKSYHLYTLEDSCPAKKLCLKVLAWTRELATTKDPGGSFKRCDRAF